MTKRKEMCAKIAATKYKSPCCSNVLYHFDRNLAYCEKCGKEFCWLEDDNIWEPVIKAEHR